MVGLRPPQGWAAGMQARAWPRARQDGLRRGGAAGRRRRELHTHTYTHTRAARAPQQHAAHHHPAQDVAKVHLAHLRWRGMEHLVLAMGTSSGQAEMRRVCWSGGGSGCPAVPFTAAQRQPGTGAVAPHTPSRPAAAAPTAAHQQVGKAKEGHEDEGATHVQAGHVGAAQPEQQHVSGAAQDGGDVDAQLCERWKGPGAGTGLGGGAQAAAAAAATAVQASDRPCADPSRRQAAPGTACSPRTLQQRRLVLK